VHTAVQERIKSYILEGKLRPGDPLPSEAQLAEQLCVSRPVVREALRALESLGIIISRRGEGRFVRDFNLDSIVRNLGYSMMYDAHDLLELMEVRERLEMSFIEDAIASLTDETVLGLRRIIEDVATHIGESGCTPLLMQADKAFHCRLYRDVNNAVLLKLLEVFWNVFAQLSAEALIRPGDDVAHFVYIHSELLRTIEARDVEAARRYLPIHFEDSRRRVRAAQA